MKLPNIIVRILAGAVFVALLLFGILVNEYAFACVFSIITALALYEFYTLMDAKDKTPISKIFGVVAGVVIFLSAFLYSFYSISIGFAIYLLLIVGISIGELYLKKEQPIRALAYTLMGQVYIALPFALTNYMVSNKGAFSSVFLLAIFVLIWVNDSFAYLTGITFGKHRLFERISPKKSWEGFIGGAIFTIIAALLFNHFDPDKLSIIAWIGFALITVCFGTWGDLIESLMKRTLNVKDSGKMIPGHGGILDRMDSSIFAIPAVVAYLIIVEYISSF